MKPFAFSAALSALVIPIFVHAQEFRGEVLGNYMASIIGFINSFLIPFIWAIAFIVFIWGVFTYFIAGGASEEQRDKGKQLVMWGIIGFVVMSCVWGLVNLFTNTLDFGGQNAPAIPTFDPVSNGTP